MTVNLFIVKACMVGRNLENVLIVLELTLSPWLLLAMTSGFRRWS